MKCLLLAIVMLGATVSFAQDKDAPVVMKLITLKDPGMGNMDSHVVLVPKDWKAEGGGWWPGPQAFRIWPSQDIKVTAPDGRQVRVGPGIAALDSRPSQQALQMGIQRPAEGGFENGQPIIYMPESTQAWQAFLEKAIRNTFNDATNIQVKSLVLVPEFTKLLEKQIEPYKKLVEDGNRMSQMNGINMRSEMGCAFYTARVALTRAGKNWEILYAWGTTRSTTTSDFGLQHFWSIEPNVSFMAPEGQLESQLPFFMMIANSVQPTQKWTDMKFDHISKMMQIDRKGFNDRQNIINNSNREIAKMRNESWQRQQDSNDRIHSRFIDTIREETNYTVPGSDTQVKLPSHYSHVYSNGNGEFILSNNSNFNPNQTFNGTWTPMQKVD